MCTLPTSFNFTTTMVYSLYSLYSITITLSYTMVYSLYSIAATFLKLTALTLGSAMMPVMLRELPVSMTTMIPMDGAACSAALRRCGCLPKRVMFVRSWPSPTIPPVPGGT